MSAGTQIIAVEKLIANWLTRIMDLRSQAAEDGQSGLDVASLRVRLSDAEATLEYLNDLLQALQVAVGGARKQA